MRQKKNWKHIYIYINFTPRNRERAIDFYCENAGATAKEAAVAVDKIYAKRKNDGRELKEAWEWTPEGQQYMLGRRMRITGISGCIFSAVSFVGMLILALLTAKEVPIVESFFFSAVIYCFMMAPVCLVFLVTFLSVGIAGVRKMKKYDRKDKAGAVMAQSEVSVDSGSVW